MDTVMARISDLKFALFIKDLSQFVFTYLKKSFIRQSVEALCLILFSNETGTIEIIGALGLALRRPQAIVPAPPARSIAAPCWKSQFESTVSLAFNTKNASWYHADSHSLYDT